MIMSDSSLCLLSEPSGLAGTAETSTSLASKRKHPFGDLGKPTLRGVRRCPKCGTFNGTRGISCKNRECDVVFKEREVKKVGHSAESVRIVTGSTSQLYSVRLRDRGPDYRGFVQLPFIQDMDGNAAVVVDSSIISAASVCYVESCLRNSSDSGIVLKSGENACVHIQAAMAPCQQAEPIGLKNHVLNNLPVTNEMRQAIWLLATETSGPIVQRVTKSIMVVKCNVTVKKPLGFLHCSFMKTIRNRLTPGFKFQCSCKLFKSRNATTGDDSVKRKCVHFYACICAFASDESLTEEFSYFVNMINEGMGIPTSLNPPDQQVLSMYQPVDDGLSVTSDACNTLEVIISEDGLLNSSSESPDKKMKKDDPLVQASSALLTLQDQKQPSSQGLLTTGSLSHTPQMKQASTMSSFNFHQQQQFQQQQQPPHLQISQLKTHHKKNSGNNSTSGNIPVDESMASISFMQWLASVTERINQTMHYGFPGTPDPLVFHAPQIFFDCLQQRISAGLRKKRLPNFTTGFVRKEALPLGTFTKYTWHITNVLQVKGIFDTPKMALELTRTFVENRDGTFDPYEAPRNEQFDASRGKTRIRPFELKTFLKAGALSDQKDMTPFVIEWIPDILPQCHIGELRIKFEYGHLRNGHMESRNPMVASVTDTLPLQSHTIHLREILPS